MIEACDETGMYISSVWKQQNHTFPSNVYSWSEKKVVQENTKSLPLDGAEDHHK